ncbi:P-II family nitrogen regulator [Methanoculleus sp.]|jgi:nitrogen regulatory protein P-II 1|uniref:P-II family nitrogen regulator n=1 Tax=Methanoculleus sp. TaxID=90427 RepID=UPI001BD6372F|nr:P-II family nitrogen regulator [Methanoculleus sp.]
MKMVTAIIRPEKFDSVKTALEASGIYGMTISEVRGRGAQKGIPLQFRGKTVPVDLIPKMKIEMVVRSAEVDEVIRIIRENGRTGKFGDGRVFVMPIETMCKVRTDELDPVDQ